MSGRSRPRRRVLARRAAPVVLGAIAATCALGRSAQAAPATGAQTIVLESHVGQRSSEAATALAPLLDELEQRGFAVRVATIEQGLPGKLGWSGVSDDGASAASMAHQIEIGVDVFTAGSY